MSFLFFLHSLNNEDLHFPLKNYIQYNYLKILFQKHLKLPIDSIPIYPSDCTTVLKRIFFKFKWYEFIEFSLKNHNSILDKKENLFIDEVNSVLISEFSSYRIVGGEFIEITSEGEIKEVESALENTSKLSGVKAHLNSALSLMADRTNPDYRNSIKESISAVESLCKIIANSPKATLGTALNILEKQGFEIHGALKDGFSKLYGYTSDGDGIRHSMLEESTISQEDARYWLISCSTFINYLIAKAEKGGVKLN
ncbi:MAG: hypothetical protein M0D57_15640 [Sphingobacteriales bacterium JAD_PAG50586_3]|nr:MAG: hypothetical protein M0D57_15640 [Sphingobacteriales bacterium JAD_PAG50586_3]